MSCSRVHAIYVWGAIFYNWKNIQIFLLALVLKEFFLFMVKNYPMCDFFQQLRVSLDLKVFDSFLVWLSWVLFVPIVLANEKQPMNPPKNPKFPQVPRLVGDDEDILQNMHLRQKWMWNLFKMHQNLYKKCYLGVIWWRCKILSKCFCQILSITL